MIALAGSSTWFNGVKPRWAAAGTAPGAAHYCLAGSLVPAPEEAAVAAP